MRRAIGRRRDTGIELNDMRFERSAATKNTRQPHGVRAGYNQVSSDLIDPSTMTSASRTRQFVLSFLLTSFGVGLGGFGGVRAITGMSGLAEATRLEPTGIVLFTVGAACFSVGMMWLIVVMVRPFFEKRTIDHIADEIGEQRRFGRNVRG
ncbi:MAG: hypothetical protein QM736_10760 [Vicinamibacterales bacterium]